MASMRRDKSGSWHVRIDYRGREFTRSFKTKDEKVAAALLVDVEGTLLRLSHGLMEMPPDAEPGAYILSGGRLNGKPTPIKPEAPAPAPRTVKEVFDVYYSTLTPDSKQPNTLITEKVHTKHVQRVVGDNFVFDSITLATVQAYADKRAREGAGRTTIEKELATLSLISKWAHKRGHTNQPAVWMAKDITLPKGREKPPFMTWAECERHIEAEKLKDKKADAVWECLWLDQAQTLEFLEWVREHARHSFEYPLLAFAAYTGARRSEILRSKRTHWDFKHKIVRIIEKKDDTSKHSTTRSVPVHEGLEVIMRDWFRRHPGGTWTIATDNQQPIGPRMATKYFRGLVNGGKWDVLHGYHLFRHSLASNMASEGVDQRLINDILGHDTEDMERRYRHLRPQNKERAVNALFKTSDVDVPGVEAPGPGNA